MTIFEIASAEGLSVPYVAKLLSVLRHAGLIDSERGRSGGYHLARGAAEITLGAVMAVLGEPLFDEPGYCTRHAGTEAEGSCVHHGGCSLRALWPRQRASAWAPPGVGRAVGIWRPALPALSWRPRPSRPWLSAPWADPLRLSVSSV